MDEKERIRTIIEKIAGKPAPESDEESLFDSGYLDSFALPDMVGALEKEFGLSVPDSDLQPRKFESVERIAGYLASQR
jgi:acyl carrier protein